MRPSLALPFLILLPLTESAFGRPMSAGGGATTDVGPPAASIADTTLRPFLVAISVGNLERSSRWYEQHLGFRQLERMDVPSPRVSIAFLELNGFRLELIEWPGSKPRRAALPDTSEDVSLQGMTKLAFVTVNLDSTMTALRAAGVRLSHFDVDSTRRMRSVIFTDPDRNWIQLFERMRDPGTR